VIIQEVFGTSAWTAETNEDGFFSVSLPADGTYIVDASAEGFAGVQTVTTISSSSSMVSADFSLVAAGGSESEGPSPGCGVSWTYGAPVSGYTGDMLLIIACVGSILSHRRKEKAR